MAALRQTRTMLTAGEYLERERQAEFKSEYVNGEVFAMAGGTSNHDAICASMGEVLSAQLRGRPCRIFAASFKVRIDKANAFRYPDLSGLCGPVLYHDYFSSLLDYIHLNPVRAGIIKASKGGDLRDYKWSSWGGYIHPRRRQAWHHVSLAFHIWDLEDSVAGRRALRLRIERRMAAEGAERCGLAETGGQSLQSTLRRGWYYGPETFREWLLEHSGDLLRNRSEPRKNYHGEEVKAHGESEARTLLTAGLAAARIKAADLGDLPKSDHRKAIIAAQIRQRTAVPLAWIAQQLHMGTPSNVSHACRRKSAPKLS